MSLQCDQQMKVLLLKKQLIHGELIEYQDDLVVDQLLLLQLDLLLLHFEQIQEGVLDNLLVCVI